MGKLQHGARIITPKSTHNTLFNKVTHDLTNQGLFQKDKGSGDQTLP